jgi:hypothetical protein
MRRRLTFWDGGTSKEEYASLVYKVVPDMRFGHEF